MKKIISLLLCALPLVAGACIKHQPLQEMHTWFDQELELSQSPHLYGTLATVSPDKKPSTRIVQFSIDDNNAIKFFTHEATNKVEHLAHNPNVSLNVWLKEQRKQVTVDGQVTPLPLEELENIWATMPRWMQLRFMASDHKSSMEDKSVMEQALGELEKQYPDTVPMPEEFVGFTIDSQIVTFYEVNMPDFANKAVAEHDGSQWVVSFYQP